VSSSSWISKRRATRSINFLQQTLRIKGFSRKWCHWINQIVSKGSVGVEVNDNIGRYFQTKKGLRKGDSLSPMLFNLMADMLSLLIKRSKEDGQVMGLVIQSNQYRGGMAATH
jgi:hypothetical protein